MWHYSPEYIFFVLAQIVLLLVVFFHSSIYSIQAKICKRKCVNSLLWKNYKNLYCSIIVVTCISFFLFFVLSNIVSLDSTIRKRKRKRKKQYVHSSIGLQLGIFAYDVIGVTTPSLASFVMGH